MRARKMAVATSKALANMNGLLKRLIFSEVGDGQTQRVNEQHLVRDLVAEHIDHVGRPELALQLGVVNGAGVDLKELDPCSVRSAAEVFDGDVLYLDVDVGRNRVTQERLQRVGFLV